MNISKRISQAWAALRGKSVSTQTVDPTKPVELSAKEKPKMKISAEARALMKSSGSHSALDGKPVKTPFVLPELPRGVKGVKMAADSAITDLYAYASQESTFAEGVGFVGFPQLAALTQRAEYRRPSEVLAKEMTREWIKLHATGEEDKTEKLAKIEAEMKRLGVQDIFCKATEQDGFFGRSQIYLDTGDTDNPNELKTALVDSPNKIGLNKLKALRLVEPIWTYPNQYNANDPLKPDYFKPSSWFVMGKEVHDSRLLTFISKQVPDLLKPAYAFSGISLTQILIPYVNNWLRTRQSISDLIHTFSVFVLKTDLSGLLNAGAGAAEQARFDLFNYIRDNQGLMAINKESEDLTNVSVPLGSLDHLQAQSQEHMAAVSGIPLVILLGITPSGLNASSAADLDVFYSWIASQQQHLFTPHLSRLLNIIQLSLFGEIDPTIGFTYNPLQAMDEAALVNARKEEAETDCMLIDHGVISPEEARTRIANQADSAYHGLDIDGAPEAEHDEFDVPNDLRVPTEVKPDGNQPEE